MYLDPDSKLPNKKHKQAMISLQGMAEKGLSLTQMPKPL